ncbi:peptidyl-prolyl cis-trans isomerase C [Faunimonas pinastri]|uniref:Parvulin-like PPIase n=1 Tax=Faunimonas pinastri TaxID=1855383 RepID=A0A1H9NB84_9HYPH|nr:peptidylprolyl isomerase [Faunimonas pinastri]SER33192.1 peptidyl-prolyl cis-trans isomerase C [Faunimonas pinastri]
MKAVSTLKRTSCALAVLLASTAAVPAFAQDAKTTPAQSAPAETTPAQGTPAPAQDAGQAAPAPASPVTPQGSAAKADKDPNAVVAHVGNATITQADLALAAEDFSAELAQVPPNKRQSILTDVIVDMQVLAQAAEQQGLDKTDEFQKHLAFLRLRALRNEYVQKAVIQSITPDQIKAEYDKESASFKPEEEVHARHILVKTKEEAQQVIKDLESGKDFAAIAKSKSIDPSSDNGGDLGYFKHGQMVDAFEKAAFALKKGDYTKEPVQTQFGWHVIELEDKRMTTPPPLAEVEDQIRSTLLRQKFETVMADLRSKTKVDVVGAPAGAGAPADDAATPSDSDQEPAGTDAPAAPGGTSGSGQD